MTRKAELPPDYDFERVIPHLMQGKARVDQEIAAKLIEVLSEEVTLEHDVLIERLHVTFNRAVRNMLQMRGVDVRNIDIIVTIRANVDGGGDVSFSPNDNVSHRLASGKVKKDIQAAIKYGLRKVLEEHLVGERIPDRGFYISRCSKVIALAFSNVLTDRRVLVSDPSSINIQCRKT